MAYSVDDRQRDEWAGAVAAAMLTAAANVRARIAAKLDRSTLPDTAFDEGWWADELDANSSVFEDVATDASDQFLDGTGIELSDASRKEVISKLVSGVLAGLYARGQIVDERVKALVADAVENEWPPDRVARDLGVKSAADPGPLSEALIGGYAVGVSTSLTQGAAVRTADAAKTRGTKTWNCAFANSRDTHMEADGQTVGLDEDFEVGGWPASFPGDDRLPVEELVNCQCWLTWDVEQQEDGSNIEELGSRDTAHQATTMRADTTAHKEEPVAGTTTRTRRRTHDWVTRAAAAFQSENGVVVTVEPLPSEKVALAVPGGTPPADLHVTVLYLAVDPGDTAARQAVSAVLANAASSTGPIQGEVSGLGWFGDPNSMTVALVDAPGLANLRAVLHAGLADAGYPADDTHDFEPHTTLAEAQVDASDKVGMPLTFNELRLRWGPEILAYDLVGEQPPAPAATPAPETPPAEQPVTPEEAPTVAEPTSTATREARALEVAPAPDVPPPPVDEPAEQPPADAGGLNDDGLLDELARRIADQAGVDEAEVASIEEDIEELVGYLIDDLGEETPAAPGMPDMPAEPMPGPMPMTVKQRLLAKVERLRTYAAIGDAGLPIADRDMAWDGAAADQRCRKLASSDGSGDPETIDWPAYSRGWFYRDDSADPKTFGAYKLNFADVVNGRLQAVPAGIFACAAVMQGGRGGVDMPADQMDTVRGRIAGYYTRMADQFEDPGIVAPWKAAVEDDTAGVAQPGRPYDWEAVLTMEGTLTGDGRMIAEGSLTWRDLPLPLMLQTVNATGHEGSEFCGWIHEVERVGKAIVGRGTFVGSAGEQALEILTDPKGAGRYGVSVDIDSVQVVYTDSDGGELNEDDAIEAVMFGGADVIECLVTGRVMGACYDDETEILTETLGWQKFKDLPIGERVATMHPKTGAFEWQEPLHYTNDPWNGPMVKFSSGGVQRRGGDPAKYHRSLDLLVTPNHRMLVESTKTGERLFMRADELATKSNRSYRIPMVSTWDAPDVSTIYIEGTRWGTESEWTMDGDTFAALMGAYLSEGYMSRRHGVIKGIGIAQRVSSKGRKLFQELADKVGMASTERGFTLSDVRFGRYVAQFGTAREKFVPDEIKNLSARQIRIFLDHYIAGDGDLEGRRIYTSSIRMAGDLQELAQKAGMWAVLSERQPVGNEIDGRRIIANGPCYNLALRNRPGSRKAAACWDWKAELVDHHEGMVRCVTVPNESLYVRRNGIPVWCGNTMTPFPAVMEAQVFPLGDESLSDEALAAGASGGMWRAVSGTAFQPAGDTAALVASASAPTVAAPSADLFGLRPMEEPVPFTIGAPLPDGTVPCYGLVAKWGSFHIGYPGQRVQVPRSNDFRWFYTGKSVLTKEGTLLPVGPIVMEADHADLRLNPEAARDHYAHTGQAVADVRLYTNEHGIVAAGVLRPDADPLKVRRLRASDISPDWRWIDGERKIVALLAVNASGFLVEGLAASAGRFRPYALVDSVSGEVTALVAAGAIHRPAKANVTAMIDSLRAEIDELRGKVDRLTARPATSPSVLASRTADALRRLGLGA